MKISNLLFTAAIALGMSAFDAEAAKRFGGGGNLGKQRAVPAQPAQAPSAAPAQSAAAPASAAAAKPGAAAAQPQGFMGRWGGMLAGLGIGVLLASLFGAQLGPIVGLILMGLLAAAVVFMLMRLFANRGRAAAAAPGATRAQFAGIGANLSPTPDTMNPGSAAPVAPVRAAAPMELPADFKQDAFLRQAKTAFIRLQAANDARDLDDIRSYTSPEMYAELSMLINDRGAEPQKTEVVSVDAKLVDYAVEGAYEFASVRFTGVMREASETSSTSFDEIWNVRKKAGDKDNVWLIAGIQQVE